MSNILVYTRTFFPCMGGLERNTFTLCRLLHSWGHSVALLTETMEEDDRDFPFRVIRTNGQMEIIRQIRQADLVVTNGGIAVKLCFPAWFFRKRYVPIYQSSDLYLRKHDRFLPARIRAFLASKATASVTVSQFAQRRHQALLPANKCFAVPNPIDAELLQILESCEPQDKELDLLYAGRLIEGKGIFLLLEALEKLRDRISLRVAFAGEGPDAGRLAEDAAARRIPIAFLGRLDREALIQTYRKSRVLVVPSSTHTEGNPLVIAEAITCGLPVIAANQEAMVEAIGDAGCCFQRYDAADLARQIEWMFSANHLQTCSLTSNTRRIEFSLDLFSIRMKEVLEAAGL